MTMQQATEVMRKASSNHCAMIGRHTYFHTYADGGIRVDEHYSATGWIGGECESFSGESVEVAVAKFLDACAAAAEKGEEVAA